MTEQSLPSSAGAVAIIKRRPTGKAQPALDLLPRIDRALADRKMLPSRFGRKAVNDPHLVDQIKAGRRLRGKGRRVDLHDFVRVWLVVLWEGRALAIQREFADKGQAEIYARDLAREFDCSLIHHGRGRA